MKIRYNLLRRSVSSWRKLPKYGGVMTIITRLVISLGLFLLAVTARSSWAGDAYVISQLESLTASSPFFVSSLSHTVLDKKRIVYDPVMLSVVAALYSRSPRRKDFSKFRKLSLEPVAGFSEGSACRAPMSVYMKRSQSPRAPVYIILPGFFTHWRTGMIYNRTIATLETMHPDPTILALGGFLSADFLSESCERVPALLEELTADVYQRLRLFLSSLYDEGEVGEVYLLGFSGGARAALWLAAHDGTGEHKPLFERILAVSPPLEVLSVVDHLDGYRRQLASRSSLSETLWGRVWGLLQNFTIDLPLDWRLAVEVFQRNPGGFRRKAMAQFAVKNLEEAWRSLSLRAGSDEGVSYEELLVHRGLVAEDPQYGALSRAQRREVFRKRTDLRRALDHIHRPVSLYYAKDDPFFGVMPSPDLLRSLESHRYIHFMNPKFGAHLGLFVDPIFPSLLKVLFTEEQAWSSAVSSEGSC